MYENIWKEYVNEISGVKVGTKLLIKFDYMRTIDKNDIEDFPEYQFLCAQSGIDELSKEELSRLIKYMKQQVGKLEKKLNV